MNANDLKRVILSRIILFLWQPQTPKLSFIDLLTDLYYFLLLLTLGFFFLIILDSTLGLLSKIFLVPW